MSGRFVAGMSVEDVLAACERVNREGIAATLDSLGESVTTEAEAQKCADIYHQLLDAIAAQKLNANVSVKLSQVGMDFDPALAERIVGETPELHEEGVRMRFIGRRDEVSEDLRNRMNWAEELTADNSRMTLFVAFNYGGRAEIVDAARRFDGGDEEDFAKLLYAPEMNEPDILIRTSGERRLSNYLLWQCAYSELVFRDELWPDFSREAFAAALEEFEVRRRRFGGR